MVTLTLEQKLSNLDQEIHNYKKLLEEGARFQVRIDAEYLAKELRRTLDGKTDFMSSMIDLYNGRKQVPVTDQRTIEEVEKRIVVLKDLAETARKEEICLHNWTMKGTYPSLFGTGIEISCSLCSSKVTLYPTDCITDDLKIFYDSLYPHYHLSKSIRKTC